MPQLEKPIIKKRAQDLRLLGDNLLSLVKKNLIDDRKILIEELNTHHISGYDQNYIKHQIPMIGMSLGEIVTTECSFKKIFQKNLMLMKSRIYFLKVASNQNLLISL